MALSAMARIYLGRIGRGAMAVSDVPPKWRGEVESALEENESQTKKPSAD